MAWKWVAIELTNFVHKKRPENRDQFVESRFSQVFFFSSSFGGAMPNALWMSESNGTDASVLCSSPSYALGSRRTVLGAPHSRRLDLPGGTLPLGTWPPHPEAWLWPWVAPVICPCDHVLAAAVRLLPHHWGVVVCVTHGLSVWSHNDETFWWPLYSSPFKHVPRFEEESHCFCELGQGRGEIVLESDVLCGETFYTGFQLAPFHAQNRLPCSHLWTGASDPDASIVF